MTIKDWPALERPRERLLAKGPAHLTDAELLAVLIGSGTRGLHAVDLARHVLQAVGGLRQLLELRLAEFSALPGMGPARYSRLHSALELNRRYLRSTLERAPITNPDAARHYVAAEFKALRREVFSCLFLDLCAAPINVKWGRRGEFSGGRWRHPLHINGVTAVAAT